MQDHFAAKLEEMKLRHISTALYRVQELDEGNYRPTLEVRNNERWMLACAYDAAQAARGDARRAYIYKK